MDSLHIMFGERSTTKLAGVFEDRSNAEAMLGQLARLPGFQAGQLRLLGPDDAKASHREVFGRKLEPEQRGIVRTLVRSHVVLGLVGLVVGLILFFWLYGSGQPMIVSSPVVAFIAIVGFATTFGLLLGGLVSLRPDHVRLITTVRRALREKRWAVIVHPTDAAQAERAKSLLQGAGAELLSTL